jgi:hypothetical protein
MMEFKMFIFCAVEYDQIWSTGSDGRVWSTICQGILIFRHFVPKTPIFLQNFRIHTIRRDLDRQSEKQSKSYFSARTSDFTN